MHDRTVLKLFGGRKSSGDPVFEEVLVDRVAPEHYRLVASPGIVLGLAAGDVISISDEGLQYVVKERGGNLAIQLHGDSEVVRQHLGEIVELVRDIDGRAGNIAVITVPVSMGFSRIERVLNRFCDNHPTIKWYYGNVYDSVDGVTPLNWWL